MSGLLENRRPGFNRWPQLGDHAAGRTDSPQTSSMVRCGTNTLAEAQIGDKVKIAVRRSEFAVLSFKQHLQHGDYVSRHLAPMLAVSHPSFFLSISVGIGCLCDADDAGADAASSAAHHKVGLDRERDTFDHDFIESPGRFTQGERAHRKCVFSRLKKVDDLDATQSFITGFWSDTNGAGLGL